MNPLPDHQQNEKAVRLVEYLRRLAFLRSKLVRGISDYEKVLWLSDIPRQEGCFARPWGRDEDDVEDIWVEVQNRREPELPSVPDQCQDWIDESVLRNKDDLPDLLPQMAKQIRSPVWVEGAGQPEFIQRTYYLNDHPEVQETWEHYVEGPWLQWVEEHNVWESVHRVYSALFSIHQEQLRLGEEYELVLGLGLLTWQTPSGQCVRRHVVVANAMLEFEARLGKFTVRPNPDGANVRPELDMLDIGEQPIRAEETAKVSLAMAADDPWDRNCIEEVLKAVVHSINPHGEYNDSLRPSNVRATSKPVVEYAPAIILRKRSSTGLTEALKRIKEKIETGERIPSEFADLAELGGTSDAHCAVVDPGDAEVEFGGDVFFPKPANEEQRRIVEKMRAASGVLVQGPPGTGKSHTIANLVCHLLATGQRTLVTAKTPRALQVLEGLVPEELRPLCINLLGSGLEEQRSLESSVSGILRKNEEWDQGRTNAELAKLEQELRSLREERVKVDRRLRDIRESETYSQTVTDGPYRGTVAEIAQAVNRDRVTFEWFADSAPLDQTCPISEDDLHATLIGLRRFTPEKRRELSLALPDTLLQPTRFAEMVLLEKDVIEEVNRSTWGADEQTANHLLKFDDAVIQAILDSVAAFQAKRRQIGGSPYSWLQAAMHDVIANNSSLWRELLRTTQDALASLESMVPVTDDTRVDIPEQTNHRALLEDVCILEEHIAKGGKLGWGPFRPKLVKERGYVLNTVRVNGRTCANLDHLRILSRAMQVRVGFERIWGFWAGRCDTTPGPYALQLRSLMACCVALDGALSLETLIDHCRDALKRCPSVAEPIWADELQVEKLIASCRLAMARLARRRVEEEIRHIEAPVVALVAGSDAHPVTRDLLEAIRSRDVEALTAAHARIEVLQQERSSDHMVDDYLQDLQQCAPALRQDLEETYREACWETRVHQIRPAWQWAQAKTYVEEYIHKEDAPSLATRSSQIQDEINATITQIASLRGWSFCFSRLNETHRRHMEAWQQSMRRLGKGTGKHAPRHRREAQQHLNECRDAVPAWVMPLHRIWDTVDPAPGLFEVIIVDEASQCGVEALPLFYLGKKILIVGDDKQISPEAVGLPRDEAHHLLEEFLHDFSFKSSFDVESSLFDHGKLRYGTRRITLREHFRCMPEIIRFSNDLCYADTPLIPLRQYGPDRLEPIKRVFVSGGYREGYGSRVVNRPEADAIAKKIADLCRDPRYAGKTMGVVVLQGHAQGGLIEAALLDLVGAEEMHKRSLICGNPYSFQGDQRDIMFLSMVAADKDEIRPLTKAADERRFNVAASRACDQMWLFHSVSHDQLSASCLRRRLLQFFENTQPQAIGRINREDLERTAGLDNRAVVKPPPPFDSWFEVDVALVLLRKGFQAISQYQVGGKRIDLVVEGGRARLAVECDGDEWHGADQYEEDMQRQRMLERCGWRFFRVRASAFYAERDGSLRGLWPLLEERGIMPDRSVQPSVHEDEGNKARPDDPHEEEAECEDDLLQPKHAEVTGRAADRRPDQVSRTDISDGVRHALAKCPNCTCTLQSVTARVLRELGIRTRGEPRSKFERRVMRILDDLEEIGVIEKYKAKNKRVRLLTVL